MPRAKKKRILSPGPTYVPSQISKSMINSNIYHRSGEFHALFDEIQRGLRYVLRTTREVFVIGASGTGGLEAVVSNIISEGDKVLTVVNGYFSREIQTLTKAWRSQSLELEVPWNQAIPLDLVHRTLAAQKNVKAVCLTHVETSTGAISPVKELAQICHKHGAMLIVDAESSLGGEDLRPDEWGIDACVAGTQKCLSCPPGLALVMLSQRAYEMTRKSRQPRFYFDLYRYFTYHKMSETPFTPSLPLFCALRESLRMIRTEGLENRLTRHGKCAEIIRRRGKALGLTLYLPEEICSNVVTTFDLTAMKLPTAKVIRMLEKKFSVQIGGGIGRLKDKVVRIANMGAITVHDVDFAMCALEDTLKSLSG